MKKISGVITLMVLAFALNSMEFAYAKSSCGSANTCVNNCQTKCYNKAKTQNDYYPCAQKCPSKCNCI